MESQIIQANKGQLTDGFNSEDVEVGRYAKSTQGYADIDGISIDKTFGNPYNFEWTGEFFKGFNLTISGDEATIFSSGVGSGGKADFLTKNNLFGLNDENLSQVIKDEILPFIQNFAKTTLNI